MLATQKVSGAALRSKGSTAPSVAGISSIAAPSEFARASSATVARFASSAPRRRLAAVAASAKVGMRPRRRNASQRIGASSHPRNARRTSLATCAHRAPTLAFISGSGWQINCRMAMIGSSPSTLEALQRVARLSRVEDRVEDFICVSQRQRRRSAESPVSSTCSLLSKSACFMVHSILHDVRGLPDFRDPARSAKRRRIAKVRRQGRSSGVTGRH